MKKKIVLFVFLIAISAFFAGCGNKKAETGTEKNSTPKAKANSSSDSDNSQGVSVDEGVFDVELTIPSDFVGNSTQEELDEKAKEYGYKVVLNEDGSATYTMTKTQHKKMLEDMAVSLKSSLNEMIGSAEYPNFTEIEVNENFTEFKVKTKSTELDLNESFSTMAFYVLGGMYNAFRGENAENISVTFINTDTGNIIHTANSSELKQGE